MTQKFFNLLDHFVFMYLDDVLVYSTSMGEHLGYICTVPQCLHKKHVCAKRKKSASLQCPVDYLGHFVSAESIWTALAKFRAIYE